MSHLDIGLHFDIAYILNKFQGRSFVENLW